MVAILGYAVFPGLSPVAGPATIVLLACAWACILLSVWYFARFIVARRSYYRGVARDYGPALSNQLKMSESAPWWNRLSRWGKLAYLGAALASGLLIAILRPTPGSPNFGVRAFGVLFLTVGLFFVLRLVRRR